MLVIEPHETTRLLWVTVLQSIGCRPIAVANATDAEETVEHVTPDLILTELVLPDTQGAQICRGLRAHPRTSGVPILVLTGWAYPPDLAAAQDIGADVVLTKPVSIATLVSTVRKLLGR